MSLHNDELSHDEIEDIVRELMGEDYIPPDESCPDDYYDDTSCGDMLDEFVSMRDEYNELFTQDMEDIRSEFRKLCRDYDEYVQSFGAEAENDPEFIRNGIAMNNVKIFMGMLNGFDSSIRGFLNAAAAAADCTLPEDNDTSA